MHALTANFNRLALFVAYKAGHLTWAQLPTTTQVQVIKAGAAASYVAYGATLASKATTWCQATMAATGGTHLTNPALPTVAPTAAMLAGTVNLRKVA
jgi:hypothetical protein